MRLQTTTFALFNQGSCIPHTFMTVSASPTVGALGLRNARERQLCERETKQMNNNQKLQKTQPNSKQQRERTINKRTQSLKSTINNQITVDGEMEMCLLNQSIIEFLQFVTDDKFDNGNIGTSNSMLLYGQTSIKWKNQLS
jgi:hypothetical protein